MVKMHNEEIDIYLKQQVLEHLVAMKNKKGSHTLELNKISTRFGGLIKVLRADGHKINTISEGRYARYFYISAPKKNHKNPPKALNKIMEAIDENGLVDSEQWFALMEKLNIEVKWKTNCTPYE